jgi:hypothetical protein
MTQQFIITGNVEFAGGGILEGRVEAFDRDLPSREQRGSKLRLLMAQLRAPPVFELTRSATELLVKQLLQLISLIAQEVQAVSQVS